MLADPGRKSTVIDAGATDEEREQALKEQATRDQQAAAAAPTVEKNRAIDEGPQPLEGDTPQPLEQYTPPAAAAPTQTTDTAKPAVGVNTFTPDDIASKVMQASGTTGAYPTALSEDEAAARARGDNDQADLMRLMYERYHQDPAAVQAQLAAATGGAGATLPGNLAPTTGAAAPTVEGMLQSRLLDLMGRSTVPTEADPEVAATLAASRNAGQRAYERDRADLAERMSLAGMSNSGAMQSGIAGLNAARAAADQQIAATTMQDATKRRITELQNTLQLAGNQLDAKQKNALQMQIAQLQDATDRAQIGESGRQYDTGLAEKIREYDLGRSDDAAARGAAASAASAAQAESARRFDAGLQFDKDKLLVDANSNPLLSILLRGL